MFQRTVKKSRNCPKNKRSVFSSVFGVFSRRKPAKNDYVEKPPNLGQLRGQGLTLFLGLYFNGKYTEKVRVKYCPNVWKYVVF